MKKETCSFASQIYKSHVSSASIDQVSLLDLERNALLGGIIILSVNLCKLGPGEGIKNSKIRLTAVVKFLT